MKSLFISFLIFFISTSLIAQNLIQNPDFEDNNGNLDCSYWKSICQDTLPCLLNQNVCGVEFASDSTESISKFSLSIWPDFPTEYFAETYITGIAGQKIFKLELWIKSKYPSGHAAIGKTIQGEFIESKRIEPDTFEAIKKYSLIDTLNTLVDDSITIRLSAGIVDLCTYNCKPFFTQIDFREFDPTTLNVTQENRIDLVNVFPNPTSEILYIDLGSLYSKSSLRIFNTVGQLVEELNFENQKLLKLDADYPTGVYFVEITGDQTERKVMKFIKK